MTDEKKNRAKKTGLRVKEARKAKGLSQERLAELINRTQNSISMIERGERDLTKDNAILIAEACDVRLDYLLLLTDYMTEQEEILSDFQLSYYEISQEYPMMQYLAGRAGYMMIDSDMIGKKETGKRKEKPYCYFVGTDNNEEVAFSSDDFKELLEDIEEYSKLRITRMVNKKRRGEENG